MWFALDESGRWHIFAGIWTNWTWVRKVKEGETTNDVFGFLTTEPNTEVGAVHPKAMPVILTTAATIEIWMTAPTEEALKLQRPLPDGSLRVVATGQKGEVVGYAEPTEPPLPPSKRKFLIRRDSEGRASSVIECVR